MTTPGQQIGELRERFNKLESQLEIHQKEFNQVRQMANKSNNDVIRMKLV